MADDDQAWARLQQEYVELRVAVQEETDEGRRAVLVERLRRTRQAVSELDQRRAVAAEAALLRADQAETGSRPAPGGPRSVPGPAVPAGADDRHRPAATDRPDGPGGGIGPVEGAVDLAATGPDVDDAIPVTPREPSRSSTAARDLALDLEPSRSATSSPAASTGSRASTGPGRDADGGPRPPGPVDGSAVEPPDAAPLVAGEVRPVRPPGPGPGGPPAGSGSRSPRRSARRGWVGLVLSGAVLVLATGAVAYGLLAGGSGETTPVDTSVAAATSTTIADPAALLAELNAIVELQPLMFEPGAGALPADADAAVADLAAALRSRPDLVVTIVGHGDGSAHADLEGLGVVRANQLVDRLVEAGVDGERLSVAGAAAVNEEVTTGTGGHIGFLVEGAAGVEDGRIQLALISPADPGGGPTIQPMVDAIGSIDAGRSDVDVSLSTSLSDPAAVATEAARLADEDVDLVILHEVPLDDQLLAVVADHPGTAFAVGPGPEARPVLPRNLYSYDTADNEVGYVLGAVAARLTTTGRVGVVAGANEAEQRGYAQAFRDAAVAERSELEVVVEYTGTDDDPELVAELARRQLEQDVDVVSGTGDVSAAVGAVSEAGAVWLGGQPGQGGPGAPSSAEPVYNWEVMVAVVLADVEAGELGGRPVELNLANGGVVLKLDDAVIPPEARIRADEISQSIAQGGLVID